MCFRGVLLVCCAPLAAEMHPAAHSPPGLAHTTHTHTGAQAAGRLSGVQGRRLRAPPHVVQELTLLGLQPAVLMRMQGSSVLVGIRRRRGVVRRGSHRNGRFVGASFGGGVALVGGLRAGKGGRRRSRVPRGVGRMGWVPRGGVAWGVAEKGVTWGVKESRGLLGGKGVTWAVGVEGVTWLLRGKGVTWDGGKRREAMLRR